MLDIREAIKGNKNYGCDDLGLLSLPLGFIDSGAYGPGEGGGGARAAAAPPPPNFGQLRFFGQHEKIWAKPVFKDVCMFLLLF